MRTKIDRHLLRVGDFAEIRSADPEGPLRYYIGTVVMIIGALESRLTVNLETMNRFYNIAYRARLVDGSFVNIHPVSLRPLLHSDEECNQDDPDPNHPDVVAAQERLRELSEQTRTKKSRRSARRKEGN